MPKEEIIFEQALVNGASQLGIPLTSEGLLRLKTHRNLVIRWSSKVNLTTVLEPTRMAERLYLDSAVMLSYLPPDTNMHDVGTGAGFPGLVLKALLPTLKVTLSEAKRKKVVFLKQAAFQMGLMAGLNVVHSRVGWQPLPGHLLWSDVVSRAAFPPKEWIVAGSGLVAPGGRLWIFCQQHIDALTGWPYSVPDGFELDSIRSYRLPFSGKNRCLVSIRRAVQ